VDYVRHIGGVAKSVVLVDAHRHDEDDLIARA
jgi:hypothetical protein